MAEGSSRSCAPTSGRKNSGLLPRWSRSHAAPVPMVPRLRGRAGRHRRSSAHGAGGQRRAAAHGRDDQDGEHHTFFPWDRDGRAVWADVAALFRGRWSHARGRGPGSPDLLRRPLVFRSPSLAAGNSPAAWPVTYGDSRVAGHGEIQIEHPDGPDRPRMPDCRPHGSTGCRLSTSPRWSPPRPPLPGPCLVRENRPARHPGAADDGLQARALLPSPGIAMNAKNRIGKSDRSTTPFAPRPTLRCPRH